MLGRAATLSIATIFGMLAAGAGCESASIAMKEKLGIPKREQLVDRVKDARDDQQGAKKQFESALQEFVAVTGAKGSADLEAKYDKLKKAYDRSESKAEEVRSSIQSVETVADKLFKEWRAELTQFQDQSLRRQSEQQIETTRRKYDAMVDAMKTASSKMDPVLVMLKDRVLFLKSSLNAQAIASLQTNVDALRGDVAKLIGEMEASIAEANSFIDQMKE